MIVNVVGGEVESHLRKFFMVLREVCGLNATAQAVDEPDEDELTRIIEVITRQDQRREWKSQYDALVQGMVDRLRALSPECVTKFVISLPTWRQRCRVR